MLHRVAYATASVVTGVCLLAAPVAAHVMGRPAVAPLARTTTAPVSPDPRTRCGAEPSTAAGWQRLWDAQTGAWAGADAAMSVRLADGRLLWAFGDTYVGAVAPDGSRPVGTRMVRNSLVVTDGTCTRPLPTGSDALPGRDGTWLWPTAEVVTSAGRPGDPTTVVVLAQRLERTGSAAWGFARVGMAAATVVVPWLGTPSVSAVTDLGRGDVAWGAAAVREGAVTWIYGTRAVAGQLGRALLLARALTSSLTERRTWDYRTGDGWSRDATRAIPVRAASAGVSTVPSAARVGGRYVIVTKAHEFLDPEVVALVAPTPWGPWSTRELFAAPSTSDVLRYAPEIVATSTSTHLVVAVSRTSPSLTTLHDRAAVAYPTFTDATWDG